MHIAETGWSTGEEVGARKERGITATQTSKYKRHWDYRQHHSLRRTAIPPPAVQLVGTVGVAAVMPSRHEYMSPMILVH